MFQFLSVYDFTLRYQSICSVVCLSCSDPWFLKLFRADILLSTMYTTQHFLCYFLSCFYRLLLIVLPLPMQALSLLHMYCTIAHTYTNYASHHHLAARVERLGRHVAPIFDAAKESDMVTWASHGIAITAAALHSSVTGIPRSQVPHQSNP